MRIKKVLPVALAASITAEVALSVRYPDTLGPEPKPHVELSITVASAPTVSQSVSASGGAGGLPTGVVINQIA